MYTVTYTIIQKKTVFQNNDNTIGTYYVNLF